MRMPRPNLLRTAFSLAALAGLGASLVAGPGAARSELGTSLALRDTFPIGSNGLCEAQILPPEPGAGLFDRRYSVICRDAAAPVGTLWVVKPKDESALAPARLVGGAWEAAELDAKRAIDQASRMAAEA